MQPPTSQTTMVPCLGCNRKMVVPKTHVRAAFRDERLFIVFCSRACNLTYVAKEGARQQEEQIINGD